MPTNKSLKAALLKKLNVTPQALTNRVSRKKRDLPMSTEHAVYLIAFENGIKIDTYLLPEEVAEVRHLHTQSLGSKNSNSAPASSKPKRKSSISTGTREIRFPNEFKSTDALLSIKTLNEARAMAAVYPLLYVLE
ncbi:MAG: hypothetical protein RLN85_18915, partial [Pseudomonadales bacterium]